MTDVLPAVDRIPLSQHVEELIEEKIFSGQWAPGERIPTEAELCQQIGVSRSVVRDAVRTLSARGLVEVRQGSGSVVRAPGDGAYSDAILTLLLRADVTVREALDARIELEVAVAGAAARSRTENDLDRLSAIYAELEEAIGVLDVDRALQVDLRFHTAILEATHVPVLITLLRPMSRIIQRTSAPAAPEARYLESDVHARVIEGIRSGDPELACERMREHFAFIDDPRYAELHARLLKDAPYVPALRADVLRGGPA